MSTGAGGNGAPSSETMAIGGASWICWADFARPTGSVSIHAYALMDNHHHLIVQTPDANLSQGMQWLDGAYAGWFNTRHQRVGSCGRAGSGMLLWRTRPGPLI